MRPASLRESICYGAGAIRLQELHLGLPRPEDPSDGGKIKADLPEHLLGSENPPPGVSGGGGVRRRDQQPVHFSQHAQTPG